MNKIEKTLRKAARETLLKWRAESRYFLERKIFPRIKNKKVLFVGCESYNADYPRRLKKNDLWTLDIIPENAKYGAKNHVVGDVSKLDEYFNEKFFDVIFLVGIFGYGVDDKITAERTLEKCYQTLKKGGLLIVQWTDELGRNPVKPRELKKFNLFEEISLFGYPPQHRTQKVGVWEFLVKKSDSPEK